MHIQQHYKTVLATVMYATILLFSYSATAKVIYVDPNANNTDGSSWMNAYHYLQDALAAATESDEIRIAQGTYTPDKSNSSPDGTKDAFTSFELISGITIKGGHAGVSEVDPDEHDPEIFKTVLSGDILENDQGFENYEDNSSHIMKGTMLPTKVILEGLTFQGGDAKETAGLSASGGGLYLLESIAEIKQCVFKDNNADAVSTSEGAGIFLHNSNDILVSHCTFVNNRGNASGAIGIYFSEQVHITDCYFEKNGAIVNSSSIGHVLRVSGSAEINNSIFFQNGYSGYYTRGVLRLVNGELEVMNSRFIDNDAGPGSASSFTNCLFIGNKKGTVQYSSGLSADKITNCTAGENDIRIQCNELFNSIIWGTSIIWNNQAESHVYSRNCIKDYSKYHGNDTINLDPLFVDYDGPDNIAGTADDDLRLTVHSPCVDAGNNQMAPLDSMDTDQDGDTFEYFPLDIDKQARFKDIQYTQDTGYPFTDPNHVSTPIIDMGCFETGQSLQLVITGLSESIEEGSSSSFQVSLSEEPQGQVDLSVIFEDGDNDIQVVSGGTILFDSQNYSTPHTVQLMAFEDDDALGDTSNFQIVSPQIPVYKFSVSEHDNEPVPVIYVDSRATGNQNGFSWENAYETISSALEFTNEYEEITEVRMAEGIYYPGYQTFPSPIPGSVIQLPFLHGMSIKGGYAGVTGGDPNERNLETYQTTINKCELMHFVTSSEEHVNFDGLMIDTVPDIRSGCKGTPNIIFDHCDFEEIYSTYNEIPGGIWIGPINITFNNCNFQEIRGGQAYPNNGLIEVSSNSLVHYNNCTFKDMGDSYRHTFYFDQHSQNTFVGCLFDNMTASVFRDKAVFYCSDNSRMVMNNCGIINCTGLNIFEVKVNGEAELGYCTLAQNHIDRYLIDTSGLLSFRNSIIWGNKDDGSGNPKINVLYVYPDAFIQTIFEYSNIEGGKQAFSYEVGDELWGMGNIDYEPMFINLSSVTGMSDLHLSIDSPCIDMGDLSDDYSEEPLPNGGRVNIGMYGNTPEAAITLDSDGDGYLNAQESRWGLNPHKSDSDEDGLSDFFEAGYDGDPNDYNPFDYQMQIGTDLNANLWDTDNDALSDFNEVMVYFTDPFIIDCDNDGLQDGAEINIYHSDPLDDDTDKDGMPDGWEVDNGLNLLDKNDADLDADSDDLTNLEDYQNGCRADNPDSDGDMMKDGWEVENSLNPTIDDSLEDYDKDGFLNIDEKTKNTKPNDPLSFPSVYTFYVDDDAVNDPGPADSTVSDPLEDGSLEHPFDSIMEAVDHLLTFDTIMGDKIVVFDGHYPCESLSGITKPLHIKSKDGPEDCFMESGPCLIENCNGREIVIQGFTINPDTELLISNSIATIIDSIVDDSPSRGIRIMSDSTATISNCKIRNNQYEGILSYGNSDVLVEDTTIQGNRGGGISADGTEGILEIYRSVISENSNYGVKSDYNKAILSNCLIYANDNSPVSFYRTLQSTIENCTITHNNADRSISIRYGGNNNHIKNSIIRNGSSYSHIEPLYTYQTEVNAIYSNIENGWEGHGNIDADPNLFFANDGLLRLSFGSPCLNAGDPNYIYSGQKDIEGNERVIYDRIDIGAVEYRRLSGDMEPDEDVDTEDLLSFIDQWLATTVDQNFADFNNDTFVDMDDLSLFASNWMGANGYSIENLGLFANQWLETVPEHILADFNLDAFVNFEDFALLASYWNNYRYPHYGAYWDFNEGHGVTIEDSLNDWDGITINMDDTNWCSGIKGTALEFDGQQEYIQLPSGLMADMSDFSIMAWINLSNHYGTNYICSFGSNYNNKMELILNPYQLRFSCSTISVSGSISSSSNSWHLVAATFNGDTCKLYFDGVEVGILESPDFAPLNLGWTNQNYIGRGLDSNSFFEGIIDEFRFYSHCVPEQEIYDEWLE